MSAENTTEGDLRLQESRLCSRCRTVNADGTEVNRFPFRLSELNRSCHLCLCLRDLLSKKGPSASDKFILEARKCHCIRVSLRLKPLSELLHLRILQQGSNCGRNLVRYLVEFPESKDIRMNDTIPRLVDSKRADFNLVKDWMKNCFSSRNCAALRAPRALISNQYVIDCYTRKVIPAPHQCYYAALSYVWGTDRTPFYPGDTLDIVPKTIEDAIQVTRIMGITYLWVDRYCIRQDNARHKMEQIHSMHKIYSNASFTIVAAAGDSPDHGLPGVSDRHRREQPRVRLGSRLMVSKLSDPSNLICSSKWWTRGWTYQECMHSRRLLFFTDEQVYFQCNHASFCESSHCPKGGISPNQIFRINPDLDIWPRINEYLERTLTFPSDILNAIVSVFQLLQDEEGQDIDFRHLWGLPIQRNRRKAYCESWKKAFNTALLWNFEGPAARREGFPSWSWTGWFGHNYTHCGSCFESGLLYEPEFMVDAPNRGLIPLENFFTDDHDIEPPSSVLQVRASMVRLRLKSTVSKSRVATNEVRSLYALDAEEKPVFLAKELEKGSIFEQIRGCSLDRAVEDPEAHHYGIFLGVTSLNDDTGQKQRKPGVAFLLIVEEKEALCKRVGMCCAPYDTVRTANVQIQTLRLG